MTKANNKQPLLENTSEDGLPAFSNTASSSLAAINEMRVISANKIKQQDSFVAKENCFVSTSMTFDSTLCKT